MVVVKIKEANTEVVTHEHRIQTQNSENEQLTQQSKETRIL